MKNQRKKSGVIGLLITVLFVIPVYAEDLGKAPEFRGTLGFSNFLDESPLHHFVGGGSARLYLTRRLGLEPELVYMYRSESDQDLVFIPNVTWDFRSRDKRIVPYLIGGAGVLRHRERTGRGFYSSHSWSGGVGFGSKIFLSERLFVSPEVRFGYEPIVRITGSIGFVLP